ncbi:MAG: hypothetical protein GY815_02715 [Gammaproteobacteria bacterium]|nr:hypothetical protein [Gammaproteobacteria bacterium]
MSRSPNPGQCSASEPFASCVLSDDMAPEFRDGHIIIVDPGGRSHYRRPGASRDPESREFSLKRRWIPDCAGMMLNI